MLPGLLTALLVFAADQLSKIYVMDLMKDGAIIVLTPFFSIIQAWNTGISFSMFKDGGMAGTAILSLIALGVVIFLLRWMYVEKCKMVQISLGMIIGGAIGNLADRIRYGAVYDFLDFHIGTHHWPAFNIADSFICIGAFLIIVYCLFVAKNKEEK